MRCDAVHRAKGGSLSNPLERPGKTVRHTAFPIVHLTAGIDSTSGMSRREPWTCAPCQLRYWRQAAQLHQQIMCAAGFALTSWGRGRPVCSPPAGAVTLAASTLAQNIPVYVTNRMPVNIARPSIRGRPPSTMGGEPRKSCDKLPRVFRQKYLGHEISPSTNAAAILVPTLWSCTSAFDPKRTFKLEIERCCPMPEFLQFAAPSARASPPSKTLRSLLASR